jgi:predicted HTH transcriptional regulator
VPDATSRRYDLAAIDRLIAEREQESEVLDYKIDPHIKHDPKPVEKLASITAKAVCAFANSGGGELVLGIDEDREGFPDKTTPPGLPATLDGQPIVERVDRFVGQHVFPRPSATPYAVPIDGERSYVVVGVLPRGPGPYRVVRTKDASLDDR